MPGGTAAWEEAGAAAYRAAEWRWGGRVLLMGHMDTVFPDGEAQRRKFSITDRRAFGPGVLDMKSGLLVGLYALRVLTQAGEAPYSELMFLCNSDEEIGSPESHDLIIELARNADTVLVLESAPKANVECVTIARKGLLNYQLTVKGVSSHAGTQPELGRSAIVELAHRIIALHALNGTIDGLTVNVGVVGGGTRSNVVPEAAYADIDIRVLSREDIPVIDAALQQVAAETTTPDTHAAITGKVTDLPFEQSKRSAQLFTLASEVADELGLSLRGEATGGVSDANTAASAGAAVLDGLGLVGDLEHNPGEYAEIASIAPRIALLAGLLYRLGQTQLVG